MILHNPPVENPCRDAEVLRGCRVANQAWLRGLAVTGFPQAQRAVENPCSRKDAAEDMHERASGSEEVMRDGFPTALVSVRRPTTATTGPLGIRESGTLFGR
jgi:hypothetical protein